MNSLQRFACSLGFASSLMLGFAQSGYSQQYPQIDFSSRPSYLPNNVISLTFDDAPDWNNTATVLDVLKEKGVKATFFINGENWSSLSADGPMQELVRRMVREGHELANHTSHHVHLGDLSPEQVRNEITSVENITSQIFGGNGPRLTLLRAPFGEPFQFPTAAYETVAPIVAQHGVHVGWAVDSFDYNCPQGDAQCVYNGVVDKIRRPGQGDYGIVLLHSVHSQTAMALPALIDYIRDNGFQFWSVEQVVKARFGKTSDQLVSGGNNGGGNNGGGNNGSGQNPDCGAPAWEQGHYYRVGEKVVYENQVFTAQNEDNPGYNPKISYWFWAAGPLCK